MDRNLKAGKQGVGVVVALRKESVDRNIVIRVALLDVLVALRKESVDRNTLCGKPPCAVTSRSPQGERG